MLAMEVDDDSAFSRVYARFVVVSVVRVMNREGAGFDCVGRAGAQSREESLLAGRVGSGQGGLWREGTTAPAAYLCIDAEPELFLSVVRGLLEGRVAGEEGRVEVDDAERGPRAVDGRDRQSLSGAGKVEVLTESREARQRAPNVCVDVGGCE